MRDEQLEAYLNDVRQRLGLSARRAESLRRELLDHIEERISELQDEGLKRDQAAEQALRELGQADILAARVGAAGRQRRFIMRATSVALGAAACVISASLILPMVQSPAPAGVSVVGTVAPLRHLAAGTGFGAGPLTIGGVLSSLPFVVQYGATGIPTQVNHQGVVMVDNVRFNGEGYFRFALLNGSTVVWANAAMDGGIPTKPSAAVPLTVIDGIYSVRLGDTASYGNMAALPTSVFSSNETLSLRVWFDDGNPAHGVQPLSPDQPLTSSPYAFMASTVADGAIIAAKLASDAGSLNRVSGGAMFASGGNVGIGVSTPAKKLEVAGIAQVNGLRIADPAEQSTSISERYDFPAGNVGTNMSGIGQNYMIVSSKLRVGNLWILNGRWYWGNTSTLSVTGNLSSILVHSPTGWPYGAAVSSQLDSNQWGHPGPYFTYGCTVNGQPQFTASCIRNGTLNANLFVDFTLICVTN